MVFFTGASFCVIILLAGKLGRSPPSSVLSTVSALSCFCFIRPASSNTNRLPSEPHRFLHSFVGSLAFAGGWCYTIFRKWLRGFTALLGFEYRGKAAFFFCYRSVYFVESEYKNQIQDPTKEGTVRDVELYSNFKTIAESIPETPVLLYNDSGRPGQAGAL